MSIEDFNREIDDFGRGIDRDGVAFQKKIVLEALRRLAFRTPVDTGRARGNWQVTIKMPAQGTLPLCDKTGDEVVAKGVAAISLLPPGQVVWISNNVEYIEFLEEGSSRQAPHGMLRVTVEELRSLFR
jgi:hypothetical protein